jgi:RNA-directed DNA polymerase
MEYHYSNKTDLTIKKVMDLATLFEAINTSDELARLLGVTPATLLKTAQKQEYISFWIPKPGGQKRHIDHPAPALKVLQQALNKYLQAVYYTCKTDNAHGFILAPTDDPRPRNIYTNALQHMKGEWFLNIDLKDFFHTITTTQVKNLFSTVFGFPPELTKVLAQVCLFQGRLPMGAPTSPVVSNLCAIFFDHELQSIATRHGATYTRYADDLTFSSTELLPGSLLEEVKCSILRYGFVLNEQKLRLQTRMEQPEVTGLIIGRGTRPVLSKAWLKRLRSEIKVYRWLMSEAVRERGLFHAYVFDRFRQSVTGQVSFVGFVMGKDSAEYRKLVAKSGV